jgi:hypothetical protein
MHIAVSTAEKNILDVTTVSMAAAKTLITVSD